MARRNRPFPRASRGPMIRLKGFRICANLTQAALAERLGVTQNQISQAETGRLVFSPDLQRRIAAVFGVPPAEIFPELARATSSVTPKDEDGGSS